MNRHSSLGRLRRLLLAGIGLLSWSYGPAAESETQPLPAQRLQWARLGTLVPHWNRHAESDYRLLEFLTTKTPLTTERTAALPTVSSFAVEKFDRYVLIQAFDIGPLTRTESADLAQYLERGGFLFIDFCGNTRINPHPDKFLARQAAVLKRHLPNLRFVPLDETHEVFSAHFKMKKFPPQTRPGDSPWLDGETNPMRGIYDGERMLGIVSLSGLQCGWTNPSPTSHAVECMQMVANIYFYAMARGPAGASASNSADRGPRDHTSGN